MALVGVLMGSKSDADAMQPALDVLKQLGIEYEVSVISAHRTPEKAREYGISARERGLRSSSRAPEAPHTCPACSPAGRPSP